MTKVDLNTWLLAGTQEPDFEMRLAAYEELRAKRKDIEGLTAESGELRILIAEIKAGSPMDGFEALPTQTQWDVAFSSALLAVEALFIERATVLGRHKRLLT